MNECYREGEEAYRTRRYNADTRARLYNGRFGVDKCDKDFRQGYESERRRHGSDAIDGGEWCD